MIAATLWPTSPGRPAPRCLKVGLATRQPARFARQAPRLSAVGRCVAGARHRARSSTRQRDRANCHRFRTAVDPARQWPHQASRSWLSDLQLRGQAALRNVCPPGLNEACAPRRRDGAEPWQSPAGRHHAVVADALQAPTVATVLVALQKPALHERGEHTLECPCTQASEAGRLQYRQGKSRHLDVLRSNALDHGHRLAFGRPHRLARRPPPFRRHQALTPTRMTMLLPCTVQEVRSNGTPGF